MRGTSDRGRYLSRGSGVRGRDYQPYDSYLDSRNDRSKRMPSYSEHAKPFVMGKWGEDNEQIETVEDKRRREKDEESDVSVELSGSVSDSSVKDQPKDESKAVVSGKSPGKHEKESRDTRHYHRDDHYYENDHGYGRRDRDHDYRGGFQPKGEPSRRGRGRILFLVHNENTLSTQILV